MMRSGANLTRLLVCFLQLGNSHQRGITPAGRSSKLPNRLLSCVVVLCTERKDPARSLVCNGSVCGRPASMARLAGSADARGTDYEVKMAALLALRMRRAGARFQLFSNAAAARPFDDLVLRVARPAPALLALQLKHKDPARQLSAQTQSRETAAI
ncbi:Uncharacterized protein GBIM_15038 [Gryllus bimaculatus]|nr:Uncharacterized protein GBIM_15038 [Gryllus bimaculatus]